MSAAPLSIPGSASRTSSAGLSSLSLLLKLETVAFPLIEHERGDEVSLALAPGMDALLDGEQEFIVPLHWANHCSHHNERTTFRTATLLCLSSSKAQSFTTTGASCLTETGDAGAASASGNLALPSAPAHARRRCAPARHGGVRYA
eukprot:6203782-Pleurochrysis_carterae.AAC.1